MGAALQGLLRRGMQGSVDGMVLRWGGLSRRLRHAPHPTCVALMLGCSFGHSTHCSG